MTQRIHTKSNYCHASLIERFGGEAYFVVPIDSERVEREVAEVVHILQLAAVALLHQRGEVHQLDSAIVESKFQDVVAHIFGGSYAKDEVIFHNRLFKRFNLFGRHTVRGILPVLEKFFLVQIQPLINHRQHSSRKSSLDNSVIDIHNGLVVVVPHMDMRRIVVINQHIDDYPVESTYFWHISNSLCV